MGQTQQVPEFLKDGKGAAVAAEGVCRGLEVWGSWGGRRKGIELGRARGGEHGGKKYFRRFRSGYSEIFNP